MVNLQLIVTRVYICNFPISGLSGFMPCDKILWMLAVEMQKSQFPYVQWGSVLWRKMLLKVATSEQIGPETEDLGHFTWHYKLLQKA